MESERQPLKENEKEKKFYFLNEDAKLAGLPSDNDPRFYTQPETGTKRWWPFSRRHAENHNSISRLKVRKVPVKVEPKVFFANERTFLAWNHMAVTLASISIAIIAFAEHNDQSQFYGLAILPVAIAFCIYSLHTYLKRAAMIRRRDPGPYEDMVGPVILATMLMVAIIAQFAVKIAGSYAY